MLNNVGAASTTHSTGGGMSHRIDTDPIQRSKNRFQRDLASLRTRTLSPAFGHKSGSRVSEGLGEEANLLKARVELMRQKLEARLGGPGLK